MAGGNLRLLQDTLKNLPDCRRVVYDQNVHLVGSVTCSNSSSVNPRLFLRKLPDSISRVSPDESPTNTAAAVPEKSLCKISPQNILSGSDCKHARSRCTSLANRLHPHAIQLAISNGAHDPFPYKRALLVAERAARRPKQQSALLTDNYQGPLPRR
jgi:hypothetical protein